MGYSMQSSNFTIKLGLNIEGTLTYTTTLMDKDNASMYYIKYIIGLLEKSTYM